MLIFEVPASRGADSKSDGTRVSKKLHAVQITRHAAVIQELVVETDRALPIIPPLVVEQRSSEFIEFG